MGPAGEEFTFVTCSRGDLAFTIAESVVPTGAGPLPHIHHFTNEWFHAPEGGITLFSGTREYKDVTRPPSAEGGDRDVVYLIPMTPADVIYGPRYHVHGFTNTTSTPKPFTFIWKAVRSSPKFQYDDGGIRDYFEAVAQRITPGAPLPVIADRNRQLFVSEAPKFGINQGFYFLQYVNGVVDGPPAVRHTNDVELNEILDVIRAYNAGGTGTRCR